jgi:hypothetical protein
MQLQNFFPNITPSCLGKTGMKFGLHPRTKSHILNRYGP